MITRISGNVHKNTTYSLNTNVQNKPAFKGLASITTDIKGFWPNRKYDKFSNKCQDFMFRIVFSKGNRLSVELKNLRDKATATFKCTKEFDDEFEVLAKEFADKNKFDFKFERGVEKNL